MSPAPPPFDMARRLSSRRGSASAPDPTGRRMLSTDSTSTSTLTILKVPAEPEQPRRKHASSTTNDSINAFRMSFARSPFNVPPGRARSPQSHSRSNSVSSSFSRPKLSADQVYDLAKSSTNPQNYARGQTFESFTALPDDIYLPFIDRPAEISALISSAPTSRLFVLLEQTFSSNGATSADDKHCNPRKWAYSYLYNYMTTTTRVDAPDDIFVHCVRTCITSHSELIWERVKSALGVPPELDIDGSADGVGGGPPPTWDDWDTTISTDSPSSIRGPLDPLSPSFITQSPELDPDVDIEQLIPSSAQAAMGQISEGDEDAEEEAVHSKPKPPSLAGLRIRTSSPFHHHARSPLVSPTLSELPSTFSDSSMSDLGSIERERPGAIGITRTRPLSSFQNSPSRSGSFSSFASASYHWRGGNLGDVAGRSSSMRSPGSERGAAGSECDGPDGYTGLNRTSPLFVSSFAGLGRR
ncbi:hypothetical protein FISHEDRAFT_69446 [Fistulina hepatica ATCC 64428]|uniref:Uncharacterized protein n=1 Tax=Fistulina hepatica ATCC 64428 TaxID=1128425 RepID=A0A0D7AQB1_9AGAR|nr:hypothetical protein FISHEDRAFT_69446 [Fistulina hepatica ATCC 64428]